jgi:hypothetical protein
MINNFETESEILNYLMTSEFLDEELNPDELRELLFRFRHFYRMSHAKQESLTHEIDRLNVKSELLDKKASEDQLELDRKDVRDKYIVDRELTVKERLCGKIFENEYHRRFHLFKK